MKRSAVREKLFKVLFRVEFHELAEMDEQTKLFFESEDEEKQESIEEVSAKINSIIELLPELDKVICDHTSGWTIDRIGKVELTILRLAVYEMKYDDAVPESVAINEAVELAKKYGPEESSGFVNAILGKIAKTAS